MPHHFVLEINWIEIDIDITLGTNTHIVGDIMFNHSIPWVLELINLNWYIIILTLTLILTSTHRWRTFVLFYAHLKAIKCEKKHSKRIKWKKKNSIRYCMKTKIEHFWFFSSFGLLLCVVFASYFVYLATQSINQSIETKKKEKKSSVSNGPELNGTW